MNKNHIIAFITLSILVSCFGTIFAQNDKSEPIEISFMTMQLSPTFDDFFHSLFTKFETENPGVKIKWIDNPFQNYETKIMTSFIGNKAPDVMNLGSESVPLFTQGKYLLDLNAFLSNDELKAYIPGLLKDGCQINGKTYALPWYVASYLTMYNTEIFREAGLDPKSPPLYYDNLVPLCKTVREKTKAFGYFPIYTEGGVMRTWLLEAGIELYNEDKTKAVFNTPRAVEVVNFWCNLYKDKLVPSEALSAIHRRPIEQYKTGRLAVFLSGPQFLRQVKSDNPQVFEATDVAPRMKWKDMDATPIVPLHVISVSSRSEHPKEAVKFAAFVTNNTNQLNFCKETTIFPSTLAALSDPWFTKPDDSVEGRARLLSASQLAGARLLYAPKNAKKMNRLMDRAVEDICLGRITAEKALAELEQEWNELLAE